MGPEKRIAGMKTRQASKLWALAWQKIFELSRLESRLDLLKRKTSGFSASMVQHGAWR